MNLIKSYSRRILLWSLLVMLMLAFLLEGAGYLIWNWLSSNISFSVLNDAAGRSPELAAGLSHVQPVIRSWGLYSVPALLAIFILFALILWLILRGAFVRRLRKFGIAPDAAAKPDKAKGAAAEKKRKSPEARVASQQDREAVIEANQRYYLHLLSVLQREGRLVDFFEEDLSRYEDAQIGAAVRSIQENCRKAINKHLGPKAVLDQSEGEKITVAPDFDPSAIKLTGNVTGEPPFSGVLRHKGWRAGKLELPTLSGTRDSRIIAPAEVEIL